MSVTINGTAGRISGVLAPTTVPFTSVSITDPNPNDLVTIAVTIGTATIGDPNVNGGTPATTISMTVAQFNADAAAGNITYIPTTGSGVVTITVNPTSGPISKTEQIACFVTGTMIACPDGERAVETLVAGDLVLTANGETKLVRFLGVRRVDLLETPEYSPVRIPAGALADGVPSRDLRVSPEHAIMAQGVLVPAGSLIGGAIMQDTMTEVNYYHIQLDEHDVVIANGAPCETLLDTDDHSSFDNADEGVVSSAYLSPCLPRVTQGPVVDSIRAAIDARLAVTA